MYPFPLLTFKCGLLSIYYLCDLSQVEQNPSGMLPPILYQFDVRGSDMFVLTLQISTKSFLTGTIGVKKG